MLLKKYEDFLLRLGRRYIRDEDELEDYLQEVFLLAYEALSGFRGESQFSTWLYRIARNYLVRISKAPKALPVEDHFFFDTISSSPSTNSFSPEQTYLNLEAITKIRSVLSQLPSKYKIPIHLYYFENLSYNEIAEKLNLKLNTLKSYIRRGKDLMKEWIHEVWE